MKLPGAALSAILISLMPMDAHAAAKGDGIVLAYYPAWLTESLPPTAKSFEFLTHVAHAFLLAKEDGTPIMTEAVPARALSRAAHEAGAKAILSLGGWGSDSYYALMVRSEKAMRHHVREVVRIVDEFGYDGVDLDWEHPDDADDRGAFSFLATEFRAALDALGKERNRKYELSAALNPSAWAGKWLDEAVLVKTLDYINVMTYDFGGPWSDKANHNSPLYSESCVAEGTWPSVESGMRFWWETKSFPRGRLNVGIPLYGRGFEVQYPGAPNTNKGKEGKYSGMGYRDIAALEKSGWVREWDEKARVPWLYAPEQAAVIGYDDAESVAEKARWARRESFGGIFFWALGHDRMNDGTQPLIEAAKRSFDAARPDGS